jgi:acyl carrier protein
MRRERSAAKKVENMTELRDQVRAFVVRHFLFGEDNGMPDSASLLEQGVVDSTGVLELVTFLETSYGLKIADDELVPDNLDSIDRIVEFIQRKQQPVPVSAGS